jgi:hypothetical protein
MYLPSFPQQNVVPGFAFPTVGPLGLGSPPYRYGCCRCRPTHRVGSIGRAHTIGTMLRYDCQKPIVCAVVSSFHHSPPLHVQLSGDYWLSQVPELPPWIHAPFSDPGGVLCTRPSAPRTAAFQPLYTVGFPSPASSREVILMTTTIHISGLNHAACILVSPSFVLPLPGWHVGFPTDLLARL